MTSLYFPLCAVVSALIYVRGENVTCNPEHHCYTEPRVVTSRGFPGPYLPLLRQTWMWRRDEGQWGVVFTHYNITTIGCKDYVNISDTQRAQVYCVDSKPPEFYSRTPTLSIEFVAGNESKPGSFKLTILYGKDLDELRREIFYEIHGRKNKGQVDGLPKELHIAIIASGCLAVLIVCFLVFGGVLLYRKRVLERRRDHMTSLGIRRGSGVRYFRRTASNTDDTPSQPGYAPSEPTCTITMSNGARPWTVRAVMTTAPAPAACAGQFTLPKSVDQHASHAHSSGHAHGLTSASGATPVSDSVTIRISARVAEQGEGHSYTPLPTRDSQSSGEWLDERKPILED